MKIPRCRSLFATAVIVIAASHWAAAADAVNAAGSPADNSAQEPAARGAPAAPALTERSWPGLSRHAEMTSAARSTAPITPTSRPVSAPGMSTRAPVGVREQLELYQGWTFIAGDSAPDPVEQNRVSLPHRWPTDRRYSHGWYLLRLPLQRRDGERLFARFDAVPLFAALFVNGVECGRHLGSYTLFGRIVPPVIIRPSPRACSS